MFRKAIFLIFLLMMTSVLYGQTFFLYSFETIDDNPVEIGDSVREGVLDSFFEAGYIIFDDVSLKKKAMELKDQMAIARNTGAEYLISVKVDSEKIGETNKLEQINSTVIFYLYDVFHERLIGKGELIQSNLQGEALLAKNTFWFNLGQEISTEIEKFLGKKAS